MPRITSPSLPDVIAADAAFAKVGSSACSIRRDAAGLDRTAEGRGCREAARRDISDAAPRRRESLRATETCR